MRRKHRVTADAHGVFEDKEDCHPGTLNIGKQQLGGHESADDQERKVAMQPSE